MRNSFLRLIYIESFRVTAEANYTYYADPKNSAPCIDGNSIGGCLTDFPFSCSILNDSSLQIPCCPDNFHSSNNCVFKPYVLNESYDLFAFSTGCGKSVPILNASIVTTTQPTTTTVISSLLTTTTTVYTSTAATTQLSSAATVPSVTTPKASAIEEMN